MRHTVRRRIGLRVERAISWVVRASRNVRDYERLISHSEAHLTWAFITVMVSRLTLPPRLTAPRRACEVASWPQPIRIRIRPHSVRLAAAALS